MTDTREEAPDTYRSTVGELTIGDVVLFLPYTRAEPMIVTAVHRNGWRVVWHTQFVRTGHKTRFEDRESQPVILVKKANHE